MSDNKMSIYEKVRSVPQNAQKSIGGGRLKGMTDINPMWRIKALTEEFGPCGVGWKYIIRDKRLQEAPTGEWAAFVDIDLYILYDNMGWSEAIPGTGGSMFVANERSGLYVSDECFKMALTDAISVACKALGFGADIYWQGDKTKYDRQEDKTQAKKATAPASKKDLTATRTAIVETFGAIGKDAYEVAAYVGKPQDEWGEDEISKLRAWYKELSA